MNTVHAAREAAPIETKRKEHPVDRIAQANRFITAITLLLDYAVEKDTENGDGIPSHYICDALMAIDHFAGEFGRAIDDIADAEIAALEKRRAS